MSSWKYAAYPSLHIPPVRFLWKIATQMHILLAVRLQLKIFSQLILAYYIDYIRSYFVICWTFCISVNRNIKFYYRSVNIWKACSNILSLIRLIKKYKPLKNCITHTHSHEHTKENSKVERAKKLRASQRVSPILWSLFKNWSNKVKKIKKIKTNKKQRKSNNVLIFQLVTLEKVFTTWGRNV